MTGDTAYPFETNLVGAYNCLELARRDRAQVVFLSTSRVYPYRALAALPTEAETRYELADDQDLAGASASDLGRFPLEGPRRSTG